MGNTPLKYIVDKPFKCIHEKYISTDQLYFDLLARNKKMVSTWLFGLILIWFVGFLVGGVFVCVFILFYFFFLNT